MQQFLKVELFELASSIFIYLFFVQHIVSEKLQNTWDISAMTKHIRLAYFYIENYVKAPKCEF